MPLTKAEMLLAADLLEQASDEFANHGCNDCWIPDTPENREMLLDMAKKNGDKDLTEDDIINPSKYGLGVYFGDSGLMAYLADRIKESCND